MFKFEASRLMLQIRTTKINMVHSAIGSCHTNRLKHLSSQLYIKANFWDTSPWPALFDLIAELRAKPMRPAQKEHIACVHASLMRQVFHISQ